MGRRNKCQEPGMEIISSLGVPKLSLSANKRISMNKVNKMKNLILLCFSILLVSFSCQKQKTVSIEMKTDLGSIITELYPDKAPVTCENFLRYIQNDKFDSLGFYRVVRMDNQPYSDIKIEVVQGGLGPGEPDEYPFQYQAIAHETTKQTGILHKDGVFSMARMEPGTASSEFFFCIGDQPSLDFGGLRNPDGQGFAAFGKVIQGMDIIKQIQVMPDTSQMLLERVRIQSIRVLEE